MFVQVTPSLERCHWYAAWLPLPLHTPGVEVRLLPRRAMPLVVGATVLAGGDPATVAVGALAAETVPSGLDAVTRTRMAAPSSPMPSV